MLLFSSIIIGLLSTTSGADDKWVWNGNARNGGQGTSNSKLLRAENGRYGVFEESDLPNEAYNPVLRPLPSNLPPLVRPPNIPIDRPPSQRPSGLGSFYNQPGNNFGPDRFPSNGGFERPDRFDGNDFSSRPGASPYPWSNPSFRPTPPAGRPSKPGIINTDNQDPTKFETCKCAFSFNCRSPGIAFGSCDVGKKYCCEKNLVHTNGIPTGEDGPYPEVLAGPGGPVDHLRPQNPFNNRPRGGLEPRKAQ